METHHWGGIAVILAILAIAAFGGVNTARQLSSNAYSNTTGIPNTISQTQGTSPIGSPGQTIPAKTNLSPYNGTVSLSYINRSTNPTQEYLAIHASGSAKGQVLVTGWTVKSTSSGAGVTIPKGVTLYFADNQNSEENIYLSPGDTLYLSTGVSPNGMNFKLNKCSGYTTQFQTFTPYITTSCPLAKNEDLSKIPRYVSNDACFDYIDSYPACKIQTTPLPVEWSPECKNFITNLSYSSCVMAHKNDKDFYQPEWRVFLKRTQPLWKTERENIVLLDNNGKVVSSLSY